MYRPQGLDVDLYLRKSRKDIEEEKKASENGESYDTLSRHRNQLLAIAKKENHNIMQIHEEIVSGESVTERPEIQKLLRRIEAQVIDAVLVIDIDRLGRGDMLDQGILDRAFRYSGTKLITTSEYYDPEDESWELVFGIKSLVSRQELKAITRRLQAGRRESASEGKSITKKPPYGYTRDEKLKLHPDPDTAWVVKKMFEMLKDGAGRQTIALELDRLEIAPPDPDRNKHWAPSSITAIIKNEVYLGHIIWGKIKYTKRGNSTYSRKRTSPEQWTVKKNAHEPLVSQELFDAANQAHTGRWRPSTVLSKSLSNPLAGILKCEVCGYTMLYQPRKNRPNDIIRCAQSQCKGVQKSAALDLVEERVLRGLEEFVQSFKVTQNHNKPVENNSIIPFKQKAIEKKEKELQDLNMQKSNLHDLLEQRVYDIETFLARQQNLMDRIKTLEEEVRQLNEEIHKEELQYKNVHELVPKVKKVLEAYRKTNDIEKKNRLLKTILEKATYLRQKDWVKKDQFIIQLYPK